MIIKLLVAIAAQANVPDNWIVSDSTDNRTGERRIYAENIALREDVSTPVGASTVLHVACPTRAGGPPTFWLDLSRRTRLQSLATRFTPAITDKKTPLIEIDEKSSFVWDVSVSSSLHPVNARAFDAHLQQNAGPMRVSLYHEAGVDIIEFSFSGYRELRAYLIENCTVPEE